MKNYLIIGIILLFPFRLFADEPVKAIYAKITNPDNKEVTVVAHRSEYDADGKALFYCQSSISCTLCLAFWTVACAVWAASIAFSFTVVV